MPAWRDWLMGDRGRRPRSTGGALVIADVWEKAGQRSAPILPAIAEIEDTALQVYAAHGLPVRHGHYQRGPGALEWTWLAEDLPADIRFAMILERPPEHGWRYATLEDLGRYPGASGELRAAAGLLGDCRHLKDRLSGREPGDRGGDIQTAIRLGAQWHALKDAMAWKEKARLKLTTPSDALAPPRTRPPEERPPELDFGVDPTPPPAPPPPQVRARKPRKPRAPKGD